MAQAKARGRASATGHMAETRAAGVGVWDGTAQIFFFVKNATH